MPLDNSWYILSRNKKQMTLSLHWAQKINVTLKITLAKPFNNRCVWYDRFVNPIKSWHVSYQQRIVKVTSKTLGDFKSQPKSSRYVTAVSYLDWMGGGTSNSFVQSTRSQMIQYITVETVSLGSHRQRSWTLAAFFSDFCIREMFHEQTLKSTKGHGLKEKHPK